MPKTLIPAHRTAQSGAIALHRIAGTMTLATAAIAGLAAGALTAYMRIEGMPGLCADAARIGCMADDTFWRVLVTAHGLLMLFFAAIPALLNGFGLLALPRLIGAPAMAFPRLSLVAWAGYALATALALSALFAPGAADGGGLALGLGRAALHLAGLSALASAVNAITTFLTARDPARKMSDLPLFAWSIFAASWIVLLSVPVLAAALGAMSAPAMTQEPGDLLWIFSHPAILMLTLPALGLVSEVIEAAAGRPLSGRQATIGAMIGAAGIGFFLWAEELFNGGIGARGIAGSVAGTAAIVLPVLVCLASWSLTLLRGISRPSLALSWALGLVTLIATGIAGSAGLLLAGVPAAGLLHQVIGLSAIFALGAGLQTMVAQPQGSRIAQTQFALMVAGATLLIAAEFLGHADRLMSDRLISAGTLICLASALLSLPMLISRKPR